MIEIDLTDERDLRRITTKPITIHQTDRGGGSAPHLQGEAPMKSLTMQQAADYLEAAIIDRTHDAGHAVTHIGTNAAGVPFVLLNDYTGQTVVTEAM